MFVTGEQQTVFPLNQCSVKSQQRRWPDGDGDSQNATRTDEQRAQAEQEAIRGGEIWSLLPGSVQDEQLMLEQERLGDDRTETVWSGHLHDRDDRMSHEDQPLPHAGEHDRTRPCSQVCESTADYVRVSIRHGHVIDRHSVG